MFSLIGFIQLSEQPFIAGEWIVSMPLICIETQDLTLLSFALDESMHLNQM